MDIILVPGLWLDASSWDAVTPALEAAGHAVHPLTLPGLGVPAPASESIGMADWVDAVVAEIDAVDGPAVLVGHSGGGNVVWGAADARPDRVARVVFVDTVPPPAGQGISEFELVDGVVPFPGWDFFDDREVYDLDAPTREEWASRARSVPGRVPTDPISLTDERRRSVPVTLLSGGMTEDELRAELAKWGPWAEEFEAIDDAEVVKLGTGHWPQFSQPDELAQAIVAAVDR
ncbi:alpha/beta fold hydrolase [Microbacterium sp. B2969]|uniref:Alpha/beta fold hydrolase n=1 Tax=Microbacterium alkaliflavum TaxID=3248839 RepID=A0ABW7Q5R0_9MICO